jgi:predicted nucleotidyltransferase
MWQAIEQLLAANPNVVAAWLFGSAQGGEIQAGGDLDIGVLFRAMPAPGEWADLRADLQQALQFEEIDLLILNRANSILRFEAISGRALFCRDLARRAEFASLTSREYEDDMTMLRRAMRERRSVRSNQ